MTIPKWRATCIQMKGLRAATAGGHQEAQAIIAKNLERIGDHATNIAELTYYAVTGQTLPDFRPKGDQTSAYVHASTAGQ